MGMVTTIQKTAALYREDSKQRFVPCTGNPEANAFDGIRLSSGTELIGGNRMIVLPQQHSEVR